MIPLQPKGGRAPFYVIHAVGGNVLFYKDLTRYLGPEQPVFGVQARRLGGRQVGHATIEEMAGYYIAQIKEIQPSGPYSLGGSSFGGLVAYEMARQLREAGDSVGLLALFDTSTPEYKKKLMPGTSAIRHILFDLRLAIQFHYDSIRVLTFRGSVSYLAGKLGKLATRVRREVRNRYKRVGRRVIVAIRGRKGIPPNFIQIEDQLSKARRIFRPQKYAGKVTLFRASIQPYGLAPDPTLGWTSYVGDLEIYEIPGHHTSIVVEPYVRVLAEKLAECLAAAQSVDGLGSDDTFETPSSAKTARPRNLATH